MTEHKPWKPGQQVAILGSNPYPEAHALFSMYPISKHVSMINKCRISATCEANTAIFKMLGSYNKKL